MSKIEYNRDKETKVTFQIKSEQQGVFPQMPAPPPTKNRLLDEQVLKQTLFYMDLANALNNEVKSLSKNLTRQEKINKVSSSLK
jgi:hypothetical protein